MPFSEEKKKSNHIASEQRRRQNIRDGFHQLVEIVPTLSNCQRSEAVILQKSVDYIQQLMRRQQELQLRIDNARLRLQGLSDQSQRRPF
ncbi:Myc-type, basic helix-loop-helix domain-containing protein, partial [Chytridium lagenaria]